MNEESRDYMNANNVIDYDPLIVHKAADVTTKILHIRFNTNGPLSPSDVGLLHAGAGELLKALAALYIKGSLTEQVSLFRWICNIGRVGIDEEWKSL